MSSSRTISNTRTVTETDARWIANHIASDIEILRNRCGRSDPTDEKIEKYDLEAKIMLLYDQWSEVQYGYKYQGSNVWVPGASLCFFVENGKFVKSDDPGGIKSVDVSGAYFDSFSKFNPYCDPMPKEAEAQLPFKRGVGQEPKATWRESDRLYASGPLGVRRVMSC